MSVWFTAIMGGLGGLIALIVFCTAVKQGHPFRVIFRSGMLGCAALGAVHIASAWTGIALGFGWFTGMIAFVLGVPGVVLLLALNLFV